MRRGHTSQIAPLLILILCVTPVPAQAFTEVPAGSDSASGQESRPLEKSAVATNPKADLDSLIESLPVKLNAGMEKRRLPGLSVAVVHDREIIYSGAFGHRDLERKTPTTSDTIYPIASVTKVFTATMLARLCEKGVVDLETPLTEYLPEYKTTSPFPGTRATTLRQLAAHTSGLPEDAPINFWCDYTMFGWIVTAGGADARWYVSKEDLLAGLSSIELEYPPDVYSHYSNLGMQLLGMAMERACGMPFADYIQSQILKPLGMKDSGFDLDETKCSRLAQGYVCLSPEATLLPAPMWEPGCALYSGGMYSTAEDMARFVSFQFEDGSGEEAGILSTGALRRMRSPNSVRRPGKYDSYGLGWALVEIGGHDAIEHNGALLGHGAHASAIPKLKLGIVMLANSRSYMWPGGGPRDLAREIYEELVPAVELIYRERPFDAEKADLSRYEGTYRLPGGVAHMEMTAREGKLHVSIVEDPEFNETFAPLGHYEFCFAEDPARTPILFFKTGEAGVIETATFLSYSFNRVDVRRGE